MSINIRFLKKGEKFTGKPIPLNVNYDWQKRQTDLSNCFGCEGEQKIFGDMWQLIVSGTNSVLVPIMKEKFKNLKLCSSCYGLVTKEFTNKLIRKNLL